MSQHWFFIINPTSGNRKALPLWNKIQTILDKTDIQYSFEISKYHQQTIEVIAEQHQKGTRHFIGLGGDGTINEMVNGIFKSNNTDIDTPPVLGLIPVGTGNDWVKNHEILTIENLISRLSNYQTYPHDLGFIKTHTLKHYFINAAGAGLDGAVSQEIAAISATGKKNKLSYLTGTIKALFNFNAPETSVTIHNNKNYSNKVLLTAASIGKYFGSGMLISPTAQYNQGQLNITIVKKSPIWMILPQLYKIFNGQIGSVSFVNKYTSKSIQIKTNRPIPVQADGENLGLHNQISISILKHAIRILG